jgi:hypothetical protein
MNVIGQFYAGDVKSTKTRVRSRNKVDAFDQASWDDYDVRTQRRLQLEKRLAALRLNEEEIYTPVYKASAPITNWLGVMAADQDNQAAHAQAASDAYLKRSH